MSITFTILKKQKKHILLSCVLLVMLLACAPVHSVSADSSEDEPYSGDSICLPGVYSYNGPDCLPLGPSEYINELAQKGISFPLQPLSAVSPDPSLNDLEFNIARVNVFPPERAPLFSTLDDAISGSNAISYMQPGHLLYVTYTQRADINGGHYLYTSSGAWMRASPATYLNFQGLVFDNEPETSFGWIVERTQPKTAPDYYSEDHDEFVEREQVVQIFDIQTSGDQTYYMIGLNTWVERRYIRELEINKTPPAGVDSGRWIDINLYEQTLSVYENNSLIFATMIASGVDPYFTRPGLFQIYEKKPYETMSGAFAGDLSDYYYLEQVPWTMYFDQLRAIHGAYWRAWFGYPQSHGCINMSVADSHWLYNWAEIGEWVYVWDPSGETPTDPSLYTPGGA